MKFTLKDDQVDRIQTGALVDPFEVLGAHSELLDGQPGLVVRALLPFAERAWVVPDDKPAQEMERYEGTDLFEAQFPKRTDFFRYRLRLQHKDGRETESYHPYSFPPVLSEEDLFLMAEGNHFRAYDKLGAEVMEMDGVPGVCFAVWAPNAVRVSVVGDFNRWDGRRDMMRRRGATGIWELFIPELGEKSVYKYEIKTPAGTTLLKADPQAFFSELRPRTASVVWDTRKHEWQDAAWMEARAAVDPLRAPLSIYEVHLGSWMRVPETNGYLSYRDLAHRLADYVEQQGYTHVELMPVTEFPFDGSWGYQVTGFFAPTSRFGTPDDFQYFVDFLHLRGIGVIMDWVPAHFPRNDSGLIEFDGSTLYEYADTRLGEHKTWGTKSFNFARNEVRQFLINSALYWLERYHIDGIRVDAVAAMIYLDYNRDEWVPNRFGGRENLEAISLLRRMNELVHGEQKGAITVAEESTSFPMVSRPTYLGGLGFTFKWNMGWMHDTLDYVALDPVFRKYQHQKMTFGLMYAFTENFVLPISHDEVVHLKRSMASKMPGDFWQRFANLRLFYGFMWMHPGKKLLFMGQDFGQWGEWNENRSLDWHLTQFDPHARLQRWVSDLNRVYRNEPSLYEQDYDWNGFEWIDANDSENSVFSFVRRATDPTDYLVVVANYTPVVRYGYRIGVPEAVHYRELLNSDSQYYFGSNVGNGLGLQAEQRPWQTQPCSLVLTLPPLALVVLKPERAAKDEGETE